MRGVIPQEQLNLLPRLVEIQTKSFQWFLDRGLRELFHNFSPIEDFTGNLSLDLVDYYLDKEKYSIDECRDRDMTYERPIKARVVLRTPSGDMQENKKPIAGASCCSQSEQSTCCEPAAKASCCGAVAAPAGSCGCR